MVMTDITRRVPRSPKSDCYLRHVCPSFRPSVCPH